MAHYRVLFVGERGENEFAEHCRWLAANTALTVAECRNAAVDHLVSAQHPFDLIVVAVPRSGHCVPATWEQMRELAPLSTIVGLAGSHAEGQTKTAGLGPGIVRVTTTEFISRVAQQFERMAEFGAMDWSPPFTATSEDRMFEHRGLKNFKVQARVMVISPSSAATNALCDALSSLAVAIVPHREDELSDESADVLLWDCPAGLECWNSAFHEMSQNTPRTPKIVLLGFPRPDDLQTAYLHGALAVISKPFSLEVLAWHIRESLGRKAGRSVMRLSPSRKALGLQ
jgi:hypothetical protein